MRCEVGAKTSAKPSCPEHRFDVGTFEEYMDVYISRRRLNHRSGVSSFRRIVVFHALVLSPHRSTHHERH